jgi:hypothetical protein
MSDDQVRPSNWLLFSFCMLLVVMSAQQPPGMLLTDTEGFAYQRNVALGMVAVKLIVSILLVRMLGAVGIVIASVIAVGFFQFPLTMRRAIQTLAR